VTLPAHIRPMLAVAWPRPFSDPGWLFEPKWDGIRALLAWDRDAVTICGRRGGDITSRYPELAGLRLAGSGIADGEIAVFGAGGVPSFERLQRRIHLADAAAAARLAADIPVAFIAFDLLDLDGPLLELGVEQRRARLERLALEPPMVVGAAVAGNGDALWSAVVERDIEGMVAKRMGSPYRPGIRSADWRKIPHLRSLRAVVGGFTPGERGRGPTFGALVLGLWDGERLRWIGNVGTGFADAELVAIRSALDEMHRPDPPFHDPAAISAGTAWVEPSLVARVGFREWTAAGRIRHPRFQGFTGDSVGEITWDAEGPESQFPSSPGPRRPIQPDA